MSLALELYNADTPGKRAAVTRKLRTLAKKGEAEGKNPIMVVAGVKAAAKRLEFAASGKPRHCVSGIARELVKANTPGKKAAVTRKMNQVAALAAKAGKNPVMVLAGFKAAATRIRQNS